MLLRFLYFQRSRRARLRERQVVGRLGLLAIVNNSAVWRRGRGTDGCGTGWLRDTLSIMTESHFPPASTAWERGSEEITHRARDSVEAPEAAWLLA